MPTVSNRVLTNRFRDANYSRLGLNVRLPNDLPRRFTLVERTDREADHPHQTGPTANARPGKIDLLQARSISVE